MDLGWWQWPGFHSNVSQILNQTKKKTTNANGGWFPFTSISRLLGIGSLISAVGGAILDFIYIFLYHTNKTKAHNLNNKAKQKKNTTTHAGTSSTLALHTWSTRVTYRSKTVEPLQKKRAQEDVVTGSVPVEPQLAEGNIESPTEMWHFCLTYVLMWGRLHELCAEWGGVCYNLPPFWPLKKCKSLFTDKICFHWTLSYLASPPQPRVKTLWQFFKTFSNRECFHSGFFFFFSANWKQVDGNAPKWWSGSQWDLSLNWSILGTTGWIAMKWMTFPVSIRIKPTHSGYACLAG